MDIRQLKYFIAVVDYNGFSRAAEALYLSQSTLSKVVKELENELNTILIDRSNQTIQLTESGKIVYRQGIEVIHSLDNIANQLFNVENLKSGYLNIGLPPITGVLYFPEIIKTFSDLYPNIQINLTEAGAHTNFNQLLDGSIDIAISMSLNNDGNIDVIPLIKDPLVLYVHRDHPLGKKEIIEMADLKDEHFITLTTDFELRKMFTFECYKHNFSPNVVFESAHWDFVLGMVNQNIGVSVLPQSLVTLLKLENLKTIPIDNDELVMDVNFLIKKAKYISPPLQTFMTFVQDKLS